METYKEYKVMMFKDGKWKSGAHWTGGQLSIYRDRKSCERIIEYAIEQWKRHAPNKPLPEKWKIVSRDVTVTDWK